MKTTKICKKCERKIRKALIMAGSRATIREFDTKADRNECFRILNEMIKELGV